MASNHIEKIDSSNKIAVIGAGMMGPGIAQVFAMHGHPVHLHNRSREKLETAHARIRANLEPMADYGLVEKDRIQNIVDCVSLTTDLGKACNGAAFVIETITESLPLKQELFQELDLLCDPSVILCSNTSVISITEVGAKAKHRERIVGTHFYQPPFLVPLVEVTQTAFSAAKYVDVVIALMRRSGKVPIHVKKDVPGFIANRLQHALWREAFYLIDAGICDAASVDLAIRNSFGLRLPFLGPVVNADLVGLDLSLAIHNYVLPHLSASPEPSTTLRAHVEAGELGFKTKKGFLEWTDESMRDTREGLTKYLLEILSKKADKKSP